jgi:acetyltransferase-like isoleucine patch superfamily enzyme
MNPSDSNGPSTGDASVMGDVIGLDQAVLLGPCVLGHPAKGADGAALHLGPGVVIRAYAVLYAGSSLGAGVHVGHGALVREGNVVGAGSSIGSGAHLEPGNTIGARTRIHTGCFLSSVTLGDDVFVGPHVVFTDDPHPPCPRYLDCVGGARVGDGASIGAGAVVLPGVEIGNRALVGAGSVVTRSVEPDTVVVGSPARVVGRRDALDCGVGLFDHAYAWLESTPSSTVEAAMTPTTPGTTPGTTPAPRAAMRPPNQEAPSST